MEAYLKLAKDIADEAAEIALKYFGFDTEKTWKSDNSPLTQADTEINSMVIRKISESYPEHSVIGEEESFRKEGSKYAWLCDPIDGTMPFSCGLPIFTFSLALVDQETGQPILGLVNDPIGKNMYWAASSQGAFRNGQKIRVSSQDSLLRSYLSVDGSGSRFGLSAGATFENLQASGAKVFKLMSVVYGAIQVPNGGLVGSVFFGKAAHDVAALKIIVEEAGGKATDLSGASRRYDEEGRGFVASNGILHDEILKCIK